MSMIVPEHPAEVFTTGDGAGNLTDLVARLDDRVGQALMIPLALRVRQIFADGVSSTFPWPDTTARCSVWAKIAALDIGWDRRHLHHASHAITGVF